MKMRLSHESVSSVKEDGLDEMTSGWVLWRAGWLDFRSGLFWTQPRQTSSSGQDFNPEGGMRINLCGLGILIKGWPLLQRLCWGLAYIWQGKIFDVFDSHPKVQKETQVKKKLGLILIPYFQMQQILHLHLLLLQFTISLRPKRSFFSPG